MQNAAVMNILTRKLCSAQPITCACGYAGTKEKGEGATSKGGGIRQERKGMLHMTHASTSLSVLIKHNTITAP
jgi:hypothetical protein